MTSQQQTDQIEYSPLVFSVQPDWYSTPINEHFWMNCARYTADQKITVYGQQRVQQDGGAMTVHPEEKFREDMRVKLSTELGACQVTPRHWGSRLWHELRMRTTYQGEARDHVFRSPLAAVHRTSVPIYSLDQCGSVLVVSEEFAHPRKNKDKFGIVRDVTYNLGGFSVLDLSNLGNADQPASRLVSRVTKAHAGPINSIRLFPSAVVALTCGSDALVKIWSLLDIDTDDTRQTESSITFDEPAATLRGHTQAVLSSALIDRGRNLVTSSRDGTCRLFDVPSQSSVHVFSTAELTPVNQCFVSATHHSEGPARDSRDVGTENKLLIAAANNGACYLYDLRTRDSVDTLTRVNVRSPATSCTALAEHYIVVGHEDGAVITWDKRHAQNPVHVTRHQPASVTSVAARDAHTVAVTTADGTAYIWNALESQHVTELVNSSVHPIFSSVLHKEHPVLFVGTRDGQVTCFEIS
jgi:proteasomal ATPase-associated factor 1